MVLIAEIIIIGLLIIALAVVIIEENKIKKSKVPRGTVKEYWDGRERRQSIRVNASLIVRYSVAKKHNVKLNGRMKDISSGGMRLLVNEKLGDGTLLLLEFDLPEAKDVINAEGKVMWADGKYDERDETGRRIFHTGIQFVNMKQDDKNRLVNYIERMSKIG
jgi:c-di-GMP-binding flagellar brake protein YcgR